MFSSKFAHTRQLYAPRYAITSDQQQQHQHKQHEKGDVFRRTPDLAPSRGNLHDDDVPHRKACLLASMFIGRDHSRRSLRSDHAAVVPDGTISEPVVGEQILRGSLFANWEITRRMSLMRK